MAVHDELLLRFVIQRCARAEVTIGGRSRGVMGAGLVVLFGVGVKETSPTPLAVTQAGVAAGAEALPLMPSAETLEAAVRGLRPLLERCADKILGLRVFPDAAGKMNLGLREATAGLHGGGLYVVSQFTLFADSRKGFRPSFSRAAPPALAEKTYEEFLALCAAKAPDVAIFSGEFAADMSVELVNNGPVTILLDADAKGFL